MITFNKFLLFIVLWFCLYGQIILPHYISPTKLETIKYIVWFCDGFGIRMQEGQGDGEEENQLNEPTFKNLNNPIRSNGCQLETVNNFPQKAKSRTNTIWPIAL